MRFFFMSVSERALDDFCYSLLTEFNEFSYLWQVSVLDYIDFLQLFFELFEHAFDFGQVSLLLVLHVVDDLLNIIVGDEVFGLD